MTYDAYSLAVSTVNFEDFKPWCQEPSLKNTKENFPKPVKYEGEPGKEGEKPGSYYENEAFDDYDGFT